MDETNGWIDLFIIHISINSVCIISHMDGKEEMVQQMIFPKQLTNQNMKFILTITEELFDWNTFIKFGLTHPH